jgi:hypothetical protein
MHHWVLHQRKRDLTATPKLRSADSLKSRRTLQCHSASLDTAANAMYSASVVNCATVGCSVLAHDTAAPFMMKICPVVLHSASWQPSKLASVWSIMDTSAATVAPPARLLAPPGCGPLHSRSCSSAPCKQRSSQRRARQCDSRGSAMRRARLLTAFMMSERLQPARNINLPSMRENSTCGSSGGMSDCERRCSTPGSIAVATGLTSLMLLSANSSVLRCWCSVMALLRALFGRHNVRRRMAHLLQHT